MSIIRIANKEIQNFGKPYIIAEINSSHNGDIDIAKKMIDVAVDCGCSCAKFQSWTADSLYSKSHYDKNPISKKIISKFSLSESELLEIAKYCRKKNIDFSSTPYSESEVDFLADTLKADFIKISSMEINNKKFIKYIARKNIPVILSTGMADFDEIKKAVSWIEEEGNKNIAVLHCVSIYPSPMEQINLNNISTLMENFNYPVGLSDHSMGSEVACASIALGTSIIEKHITLDSSKMGLDNNMAMEPDELKNMIRMCNNVYLAMGSRERRVSEDEINQRLKMRRSITTLENIKKGSIISYDMLTSKRPGYGIAVDKLDSIIGRKVNKDLEKDVIITYEDLE